MGAAHPLARPFEVLRHVLEGDLKGARMVSQFRPSSDREDSKRLTAYLSLCRPGARQTSQPDWWGPRAKALLTNR